MKTFIRGNNWSLEADKQESNIMNNFVYQLVHIDGRKSKVFKITDSLELLDIFKLTKKKFDLFCDTKIIVLGCLTNVEKFIQLQDKANNDIELLGRTTEKTGDELEIVGDSLTMAEIEEVDNYYKIKFGTLK